MTADKHITVLGVLYLAGGVVFVLFALVLWVILAGGGGLAQELIAEAAAEGEPVGLLTFIATIAAVFLLVVAVPAVICGIGLLRRHGWARPLGLVLGAINLFNAPFGTALGIYTFWVLLRDESRAALE